MRFFEKTLLGEEIKTVLCNMAVNDDLPSDLTQLDMDFVMETATKNLQTNEMSLTAIRVEKLGQYLYADTQEELVAQYKILEGMTCSNDNEMIDFIVGLYPVELYEDRLTVSQLWELINND